MDKVKVLFLASNPTGASQSQLKEEIDRINDELRGARHGDLLEFAPLRAVRDNELLNALVEVKPRVVHFSSTGRPDATSPPGILLQDAAGQPKPVSQKALVQLFTQLKDDVRIVLLQAGSTEA